MALNGGFFDERPKNRTMESEEKDQTVRMCSLILFYTHWKVMPSSPTAAKGLKNWRDVEIQFFAKKNNTSGELSSDNKIFFLLPPPGNLTLCLTCQS